MVIATRILTLRRDDGVIDVPIRIHAPEQEGGSWKCRYEIGWPEETLEHAGFGEDAVQALELTLNMIGALLYTSEHHKSGRLMWLEPGRGYGFPVAKTIRDLLVGDDKEFF